MIVKGFATLTAGEPKPRIDGCCSVCGKPRRPERSAKYAPGCADVDAFCSVECARTFHHNPLPPNDGGRLGFPAGRYRGRGRKVAMNEPASRRKPAKRFIVTELEGWEIKPESVRGGSSSNPPGLSCHVVDTVGNGRLVATYRSEDAPKYRPGNRRHEYVRLQARIHADRLNAAEKQAAA